METHLTYEDLNGIRSTSKTIPNNKEDAESIGIPIGSIYTPLKQIPGTSPLEYQPVLCQSCHAILNPYCSVDFNNHQWVCPFCNTRNTFPINYHQMSQEMVAAELMNEHTTIEYVAQTPCTEVPIYLFVVDICTTPKEHTHLKNILLSTYASIPPNSYVGLITYGTVIAINELRFSECPRNYLFNGVKTYNIAQMRTFLDDPNFDQNSLIVKYSEAEQMFTASIDNLEADQYPILKGDRASRCTGAALSIAVALLKTATPGAGGHILLFTNGPITKGPGAITPIKRTEPIRQHRDIDAGKAPMVQEATEFFTKLGEEAAEANIVINYLSASFEETGLHELLPAVNATGGFILPCETWNDASISTSLEKFFTGEIVTFSGSNATISVHTSPTIKLAQMLGPGVPGARPNEYHLAGILPTTSLAFQFGVVPTANGPAQIGSRAFVQYITTYTLLSSCRRIIRVTTDYFDFTDKMGTIAQLDQEAAAAFMAKCATARNSTYDLDQQLVNAVKALGSFTRGNKNSISIPPQLSLLPQFIFHLRRSAFKQKFNSTPDQMSANCFFMETEAVGNTLLMMQPVLKSFGLDGSEEYVPLAMSELRADRVLLLDTFFRALVWHGSQVAAWREAGYQNDEKYANLQHVLQAPLAEATALVGSRFPAPALVTCDQDSSLARYLVARCSPAVAGDDKGGILGGDITYEAFFDKLRALVVK